jgi:hypothetical protein
MKKIVIFLVFSLFTLVFFACEFKLPTAIEIKGSPSVRFAETVDIGKMFTDLINNAINGDGTEDSEGAEGMDIVECTNPGLPNVTFVIHMDFFEKVLTIDDDAPESIADEFPGIDLGLVNELVANDTITLDEDKDLINSKEPMILPLSSLGSYLTGFHFKKLETKLYFSGAPVIKRLRIEVAAVKIDDKDQITEPEEYDEKFTDIEPETSHYNVWKDGYEDIGLPSGGRPFDLPPDGKDVAVFFRVIVPEGVEFLREDLDDALIKVEAVVWLQFVFEADDDDAELAFPDGTLFSSENDLFGREKPNADNMMTDIVESLSLKIVLNKDPFYGADLVVYSKKLDGSDGIEIKSKITDNSLPFNISKEDMDKINLAENWPFKPNFKLKFSKGETLNFPKEFNATDIIFDAKIKYRIDF